MVSALPSPNFANETNCDNSLAKLMASHDLLCLMVNYQIAFSQRNSNLIHCCQVLVSKLKALDIITFTLIYRSTNSRDDIVNIDVIVSITLFIPEGEEREREREREREGGGGGGFHRQASKLLRTPKRNKP